MTWASGRTAPRYTAPPARKSPPMSSSEPTAANTERRYDVHRADLPLSCPTPAMALWNSHPRVYLPLEDDGEAACPYCGARFVLID
jgi:uncharacterized Zn-finger protein